MNGSIYERELAGILSGNPTTVDKISKRLDPVSRSIVQTLKEKPFYVVRAAGSLGADIVAVRDDFSLVIEVKSSIHPTIMFTEASGMRQEQAERLQAKCLKSGLFLMYAYRLKNISGDAWRMYSIPGEPTGRMRLLYSILSNVGETKKGNYTLKWENGTPLVRFIDYLNQKMD